jgi:hypothetical protein
MRMLGLSAAYCCVLLALGDVEHAQRPVEAEMVGHRHHLERARARRKGVDFDAHVTLPVD